MTPSSDNGYALDLLSAVRHVATKLEEARPSGRALPVEELVDYQASNGDLSRIKLHEVGEDASDVEATRWLIEKAIAELDGRLEEVDGSYSLKRPLEEIRYRRKKLHPIVNEHAQLRNPFDPLSGEFSENIRRVSGKDKMEELRESMREFGWLPEFPAIKDERGVIIVGHRRMAVAEELEIEPVVRTIKFGQGDEGDARRFRLAIASNIGAKPFTPEERARIARYLYGEREWSQQRIAEALKVSQMQVSRDVAELNATFNSNKPKRGRKRKRTPELDEAIRRDDKEFGGTLTRNQLADAHHVSRTTVDIIRAEERVRQDEGNGPPPAMAGTTQEESKDETGCVCPVCGNRH